jgi:hypothetical protein
MDEAGRKAWVVAILAGVAYFVVGFGFARLDDFAISDRGRFMWRLGAWFVSAAVYAAHLGHEHFRLRNSPAAIALHAGMAVGLGAFLLAVAATVHALRVVSHAPYSRYLLALVLWPILTGLPAFLVALVIASVLAYLPRKRLAG